MEIKNYCISVLVVGFFSLVSGCGESPAIPIAKQNQGERSEDLPKPSTTHPESGTGDVKKKSDSPVPEVESGSARSAASPPATAPSAEPLTPQTPVPAISAPKLSPAGQAASRSTPPLRSNEVLKISFDDLNCGMQADIVFRDWMLTERVKELDGQRVRISGYMLPFVKLKGISEFVLLRNTECKFGPGGQADHLIQVKLEPGVTTQYTLNPIEVVGILKVNPTNGPDGLTWSLFDMTGNSVGVLRR